MQSTDPVDSGTTIGTAAGRAFRPRATRAFAFAMAVLAAVLALPSSAGARDEVDLQLVLAIDVSGSVNHTRFVQQQQGYVAAFRNPRVLRAIATGANQAIAVSVMQWTGPALQIEILPWTRIGDEASMHAFAAAIDAAPRRLFSGGTSISGAIDYGVEMLARSPFVGGRKVIDVSGDGRNNRGRPVTVARDEAVAAGIVINGLPILAIEPELDTYYIHNVIGGPNSFIVAASSFEEFADAILKKLIIEIADGGMRSRPLRRAALLVPLRQAPSSR